MNEAEYRALPALSGTGCKSILRSPAKYRYELDHPTAPTPAMLLGTCVHTAVLGEGPAFTIVPGDRRTKAVRELVAEAENAGLIVLNEKDGATVEAMADAVQNHELAAGILSEGRPEQVIRWDDPATGAHCKGRIDWMRTNAIVDLKTTVDASEDGFTRQAADLYYDVQAEFYREGVEQTTGTRPPFLFVCVEKDPPHLVAVHQLPPEAEERGRRLVRDAIDTYHRCTTTNTWPAYGIDILTGAWPRWAA